MTRYYTKEHEWIDVAGDMATIGITDHAQQQLGDIVFVDLPAPASQTFPGHAAAVVESVKAASDVFSPVSGEVTEANSALENEPALVNTAPESDGWFYRLKLSNLDELKDLMDADAYTAWVKTL